MKDFFKKLFSRKKPLIKRIWYDEEKAKLFIHTNCRSGLFYLPINDGKQYAYWLADIFEIRGRKLPKDETIYRLIEIKDGPPPKK